MISGSSTRQPSAAPEQSVSVHPNNSLCEPRRGQAQGVGIGFAVDQKQIGLDMTLTVACPIAAQIMIAVPWVRRPIFGQVHEHGHQVGVKRCPVAALAFPFIVTLERR
jgi:hypothetical protein